MADDGGAPDTCEVQHGGGWCFDSNYNSHTLFTQKLVQHRPVIKIFALHQVVFFLQLSTSSLALFLLQIHNYTQNLNQPNSHFKAASILFTFTIFDRSSIRQDFARFEIRDLRSICSFLPNLFASFDFVWSTYFC